MTGPARRWIGGAFTVLTLGWLLLVAAAPAVLARGAGGRAATMASAGAYVIGGVVCHQRADRSFHPGGVQMPVCARCFGLYLGAGLGVLAAAAFRRGRGRGGSGGARTGAAAPRRGEAGGAGGGRGAARLRWVVLAAAAPTGITFAAEAVGWMPSVGELRAAAGVPLGVVVTWVASLVIHGDLA